MKNLNLNLNPRLTDANNITISSQKALKTYIDSKRILLNFLQDSTPTTFQTGNKWLNTSNLKLYTAISSSNWDSGISITTNELYTFDNVLYHYNGTNLSIYSTDTIKEQNSGNETKIWIGTQNEYDALSYYDNNTIYQIIDNVSVISTLLATQQEFNNSAQNRAATPYQVNQSLGNYMPLAGGNFDTGAVVRFTNGNGTNSISYDSSNVLNITNNVSVGNNLTANNIVVTSGNIYKTNISGANVIWSSDKAIANGIASLDLNAKVPATQLPLATNSTVGVVQGDGTTTSIDANGVISVIGGGGGSNYNQPLLSFRFFDHLLDDQSWLRADTFSWQSGATYSNVYNELESEYNNEDSEEKIDIFSTTSWTQPASAGAVIGGDEFAVYTNITTFDEYHGIQNAFTTGTIYPFETTSSFSSGNFIIYNPLPICITSLAFTNVNTANFSAASGTIYGSNDNSTWTEIYNYTNSNGTANATWSITFTNTNYYKYYKVTCDYTTGAITPGGTGYWAIKYCAITATISTSYITYKKTPKGYNITQTNQETNIIDIFNNIGVAWYYILDTTNTRFKLPRTQYAFVGLRDTVGKYVEAGLPNITGDTGFGQGETLYSGAFYKDTATKSFITGSSQQTGTNSISFSANNSNSIYGNSTTVQPPATQMYLYFYVGNFSQSATEQTAGLNSELFNGKVDLDGSNATFVHIVETYSNGTDWYRIWSDGWCEQGGESIPATQIVLLKQFKDTTYTITGCPNGGTNSNSASGMSFYNKTATGFYVTTNANAYPVSWVARGYVL